MARSASWDVKAGRRMWAEGWSANYIASTLNAPVCTVLAYANQHGWPRRAVTRRPNEDDRAVVAAKYAPQSNPRIPQADEDVQRYRREKRARETRVDAQMADARRLFLLLQEAGKPKRGRPKQSIGRAENARERAA